MKTNIIIISIFISLISCDDKPPVGEPMFDKEKAITEIKSAYSQWALASQNKDIPTMYRLSYPGGNFEGMTDVCIEQWRYNSFFHWKFGSINVRYVNVNEAEIDGISDLIQGLNDGGINGTHINFKKKFKSGAIFYKGKWLLDGFNDYETIEEY